jgi:serine/threonine protein kinase
VLIDGSGNPCLTDFGLATVVGDVELQLTTTTANHNFNPRWHAPEVIGIDRDPVRPTIKSDIYSFGSVMFLVRSFVSPQLYPELSDRLPREIRHGKRRGTQLTSSLSSREELNLCVPATSLTITGT